MVGSVCPIFQLLIVITAKVFLLPVHIPFNASAGIPARIM